MTDRIYLDHNATTPLDPAVVSAMEPFVREIFGNPSSVEHEHGHAAAVAVERAREQVASSIGARPNEIVFTGSCTEADNVAIIGAARAYPDKKHVVTTSIEHPAVMESVRALEREGWRVTYLPVDEYGQISMDELRNAVTDQTSLVSVMAANNEVGTLQPVSEIGAFCASKGILFHSDMAQVSAGESIDVARDNIHLASFSGHKAYGPKGVGVLYVRSRKPRAKVLPILFGGGQERGLRPGTLNVPAIVGIGEAFTIARTRARRDNARLMAMCSIFRDGLLSAHPSTKLNGHPTIRLANNLSFSIDGIEPLALMRRLRSHISFSASSACATDKVETSPVLKAMFGDVARARNAFRIAPGRFTTNDEMSKALEFMLKEIAALKGMARSAA
ncbi:aminotransferase class V-fold PLP-dependent enzyme [Bradyrhizobium barranii subsp. apii]|uniref:cysteine desulfurase family protein n=1 Tax=Bradyrhizobium barranii TaxID=2992140 RepID=UPI001AA135C7|nr:aminotransferase class V-fold PLP-dependent enzyme [Bradyrhizobium barranii]UPT95357.1 aminotransferase class V-fold PLP-dependent enzyme [Bradyrhizobium barranii subsp. apii]